MGHSTSSGRTASFSREAQDALERTDVSLEERLRAYNRAMDEADRNRVSSAAERAQFQRDRERQERVIRSNNRILGRNMSDEEVARRANRGAEANAANRRRRGR